MAESWFRHDTNARNDIKLVKLRRKGLDRIGLFWCVVEMLRETEGWKIPIDDVDDILYDLRCEKVVFDDLFECGLIEIDESFFWSNSLMKRMEEYELVLQKRRDAGSKGGKKKADNIGVVASAKQVPSKVVASAKQNYSKSLANRVELIGVELIGVEKSNSLPEKSGDSDLSEKETRFEKFWEYYGRKGNKQSAKTKFMKLSNAKIDEMKSKVKRYLESTPDKKFRLDAEKYLDPIKEHWNDEIEDRPTGSTKKEDRPDVQLTTKAVFY